MTTMTPPQQTDPTSRGAEPQRPRSSTRSTTRRALLGGGLATLVAAGGGGWWAADRYLIDHVEVAHTSALSSGTVQSAAASTTGTTTADSYSSATAQVAIDKVVTGSGDSTVTSYIADVRVSDATILRSAFANDQFGENIIADPSVIAGQVGAVFAINGDYYGFRDTGIVIRNGVAFRDKGARQGLAFHSDGSMRLYDETATDAKALLAEGVWQTWSFGPGIVEGGTVASGIDSVEIDTNVGNHSIQGRQPRTGIGLIDTNHLVFVATDGRSAGYSRGVTMTEFAQIFVGLGAEVAYNLDGGGSTTMVLGDTLVNNPLGQGQERGTSDIIYIAG